MNYNRVTIGAPKHEMDKYLGYHKKASYAIFNMHRLYPEKFPKDDPAWLTKQDIEWFMTNTGSKSFLPSINVKEIDEGQRTLLLYETIWSPNNGLLQRLHEKTGWKIINEYESPDFGAAWTFTCEWWNCTDDTHEYRPECDACGKKYPCEKFTRQDLDLICHQCLESQTKSC